MEDVVDDSFDLDNDTTLDGAQVIGVYQLESIFTCISCKRGAVKKTSTTTGTCQQQWRKKMFLNRGAVNKIARKARKNFFGSHDTPSNHAHYYANLAVK